MGSGGSSSHDIAPPLVGQGQDDVGTEDVVCLARLEVHAAGEGGSPLSHRFPRLLLLVSLFATAHAHSPFRPEASAPSVPAVSFVTASVLSVVSALPVLSASSSLWLLDFA